MLQTTKRTQAGKSSLATKQRRARKSKDITHNSFVNFNGVPLPIQNKPEWGSYRPILFNIHNQLSNMLSHHCKVYCMRFDFHVNPHSYEEGHLSKLIKKTASQLKTKYKLNRIAYVWAREVTRYGKVHYHMLVAVNGNKVNSLMGSFETFQNNWQALGHPRPSYGHTHMITNTVDETFKNAFNHFSYLAKTFSKDEQPIKARNYSSSNIPPCNNRRHRTL